MKTTPLVERNALSEQESKTYASDDQGAPGAPEAPALPETRSRDLEPTLKPRKAARLAVKTPLKAVELLLPAAAMHWQDHVEYVHQLRVSTRRATAALDVFASCFKDDIRDRARRALRRIRRAAGDARDCDVHLALFRNLREEAGAEMHPAIDHIIDVLELRRIEAQDAIAKVAARYPAIRVRELRRELQASVIAPGKLRRLGRDGGKGPWVKVRELSDMAAAVVPPAAFAVRQEAEVQPWDEARLHEVRIAIKRLRYACELFYGSMTEERQVAVKGEIIPLVDRLGAMNDVSNVLGRIRDLATGVDADDQELRDAFAALIGHFEKRKDDACAAASSALRDVLEHHVFEMLEGGDLT